MAAPPEPAKVTFVVGDYLNDEGGTATPKDFSLRSPFGLDFDGRGNMLIAELYGGRLHERTADGKLAVVSGDGSKSYRGDGGPIGEATYNGKHNVVISRKRGKAYISDTWNHCIREIDLGTRTIRTIAGTGEAGFSGDGGPASEATFNDVMCVMLDSNEDALYVADLKNRRVRKVSLKDGTVRTVAGNGKQGVPEDGAMAVDAPLVDPRAAVTDSRERIYVLERNGHALRRVENDGTIRTVAGTGERGFRDGAALEAQLGAPKHVCVDDQDRVYIADDANAAIRCYDPETETVTTLLGRGFGDPRVKLHRPHGVTIWKGDLYVCDSENDRIFKIEFKR